MSWYRQAELSPFRTKQTPFQQTAPVDGPEDHSLELTPQLEKMVKSPFSDQSIITPQDQPQEIPNEAVPQFPEDPASTEQPNEPPAPKINKKNIMSSLADPKMWKKLGLNVKYCEVVAKHWVQDKCEKGLAQLNPATATAVKGSLWGAKMLTKGFFSSYILSQKAAQAVARQVSAQKGVLSSKDARKLRSVCSTVDMWLYKPLGFTLKAYLGHKISWLELYALTMIPIGSATYLAYSTVANKAAVSAAAKVGIAKAKKYLASKMKGKPTPPKQTLSAVKPKDPAMQFYQALSAHKFNDYYYALLLHAMDQAQSIDEGIQLANQAFAARGK